MVIIEPHLLKLLATTSGVPVFLHALPIDAPRPALTFQCISQTAERLLSGQAQLYTTRVQVDVFAPVFNPVLCAVVDKIGGLDGTRLAPFLQLLIENRHIHPAEHSHVDARYSLELLVRHGEMT